MLYILHTSIYIYYDEYYEGGQAVAPQLGPSAAQAAAAPPKFYRYVGM